MGGVFYIVDLIFFRYCFSSIDFCWEDAGMGEEGERGGER